MKDEELYTYVKQISKNNFEKEYNIDKIKINREAKIRNVFCSISEPQIVKIDDALLNWNNCFIFVKYTYIQMLNYKDYLEHSHSKEEHYAYDYWYRKHIEETFKGIQTLYDKSFHIIKYLFNLDVLDKNGFIVNVINKLKEIDEIQYKKLQQINKRYSEVILKIRNNIEHNFSELFPIFEYNIGNGNSRFCTSSIISTNQALVSIEKIIKILETEKVFIRKNLTKKFPYKFKKID